MDRADRPMGQLSDVQPGWDVYGSDEQKVGNVDEVRGEYLIAHKGLIFPKDLYIPVSAIRRIEHDRVYLNVAKDQIDAQGWDTEPTGRSAGTRADAGMATGGTTRGPAGGRREVERTERPAAPEGGQSLYLHEEQLQANKERVQAGEVRIGKEVVEEQKTLEVPVTREEVYIERRPGDRQPDSHPIGQGAEREIRVPVTEERVDVEKVPVVTEEVRAGTRQVQETRQVSDTVRREQARIDREGEARVAGEGGTGATGTAGSGTWAQAMPGYRSRWQQRAGASGGRWEDVEPGYRYGYDMRSDPRYRDRDWATVEPELRRDWATRHPDKPWDRAAEAIREAWEGARGR